MSLKNGMLLVVGALLSAPAPSSAEMHRVDDSATQVLSRHVRMKWDDPTPHRGARSTVSGDLVVLARLELGPWAGRDGRIFLSLPTSTATPVTAVWTTRGRLLPGTLRTGERALVYAGPIPAGMLEDTLHLVVQADGRDLVHSEQLDFVFEIDPGSP